jgi:monoamine oxidase
MAVMIHLPTLSQARGEKPVDVLIVGAGLAGLSTAYRLQQAGMSYKILELTPHIGGRIRTASYPEQVSAEVGLEEFWEKNPTLEIIRKLKIPVEGSPKTFSSYYSQNQFFPFTQNTNEEFLNAILSSDEMRSYRKWDLKMIELYQQIEKDPHDKKIAELKDVSFAEWMRKTSGLSPKAMEFVRIHTEPEYATSWEAISALDGIAEWQIFAGPGMKVFHVVGGNQRAAQTIAQQIGKKNIVLNMQVTNIHSRADYVEVVASDTGTFQQRIYQSRYVVSTVPLFRLHEIQFDPPLSAQRKLAIQTQTWGAYFTAHAILARDASRYWTKKGNSILPILSDGPLGVCYEGEETGKKGSDLILNFLVTGNYAEKFNARTGSLDDVRDELLQALETRWPGIKKYVKKWVLYRYHPRAIASWPVGRSRFDSLSDEIRKPQGRVYFAGDFTEGTHSDGAAWSAIRVVRDMIKRDKKDAK